MDKIWNEHINQELTKGGRKCDEIKFIQISGGMAKHCILNLNGTIFMSLSI